MPEILLRTKLYVPQLRTNLVPRPQLLERLNQGLQFGHNLTLISAPAGFGKTTLLGAWVDTLECPVTWLSLDPEDDDPGRFLVYLIAALQKLDENLGQEILEVLHSGQLPPGEIIGITLINDILELPGRFVLVIDDLQMIQDRFILQLLEQFVVNIPPSLHLVMSTREDPPLPLARFRANNQLTEIRARELRFTADDTNYFLNEVLSLSLSMRDIATLENKTEGWVAGLQLAGLSIRDRTNPSNFIATLSGTHRLILGYLTEQVLDRQPEEIRRFLLQTALLDRLNGDLCNAVTGRTDSHALLERLYNANLFMVPLDDEGHWYRYHHLFADLLRNRQNAFLQKNEIVALQQCASQWYAQEGLVSEAIQHALAAEAYDIAVALLESHAMELIMQGYAKTVNGWLETIPEHWRSKSPKTILALAWTHMFHGNYRLVSSFLQRSEVTFADDSAVSESGEDGASLKADWLVIQSLMAYMQGKTEESQEMAVRALGIAPEQDSRICSLAHYALASNYRQSGEFDRATDAYQKAIQHGRFAENLIAEMLSTIGLAEMAFEYGQLHLAVEIVSPLISRVKRSASLPPISAVLYGVLGEANYQWLRLEQARFNILRSLRLSMLGGFNTGAIFCHVYLSRIAQIDGDLETAASEIQEAIDLFPVEVPDYVRQEVVSQQVSIYLARKRPDAAEMVLQEQGFSFRDQFSYPNLHPDQSITYSQGLLYNSSLRVLIYQTRTRNGLTDLRSGINLADRLIVAAFQDHQHLVGLSALLLRAQLHALLGNSKADLVASQSDYIRALELAEPEGFIGVFVEQGLPVAMALADLLSQNRLGAVQPDYIERILTAFPKSRSPGTSAESHALDLPAETGPAAPIDPLTEREMEVLRLIARGLKYKDIAASLVISLNTVRFHVKTIYSKLNVNNRTQAIEVARQHQIL